MSSRFLEVQQLNDVLMFDQAQNLDLHLHSFVIFLADVPQRDNLDGHLLY